VAGDSNLRHKPKRQDKHLPSESRLSEKGDPTQEGKAVQVRGNGQQGKNRILGKSLRNKTEKQRTVSWFPNNRRLLGLAWRGANAAVYRSRGKVNSTW